MPTPYNPTRAIASSTNATPIVLTFVAGHNFSTGQQIVVTGHLINTAANGAWTVTKISGTILSLNGSSGSGVGGATGNAYTTPTAITGPSDGDGPGISAADVNTPLQGLADGLAYALATQGALRMVTFTATTTWTPPPGVTSGFAFGCGGGGGGGGGGRPDSANPTTKFSGGGGGGGAAKPIWQRVTGLVPGTPVTATVDPGGSSGLGATANNTSGADGGNGGDSSLGGATFVGARGGKGGTPAAGVAFGGHPNRAMDLTSTAYGAPLTGLSFLPNFGGNVRRGRGFRFCGQRAKWRRERIQRLVGRFRGRRQRRRLDGQGRFRRRRRGRRQLRIRHHRLERRYWRIRQRDNRRKWRHGRCRNRRRWRRRRGWRWGRKRCDRFRQRRRRRRRRAGVRSFLLCRGAEFVGKRGADRIWDLDTWRRG